MLKSTLIHSLQDIQNNILDILKETIITDSFLLVAQPIISFDGSIVFYEILSRIIVSDDYILHPNSFLPIARSAKLLPSLDKTIIRQTLKHIHNSSNENSFSINITPKTLVEPDFMELIKDLLLKYHINPNKIIFEIIESDIVNQQLVVRVINELRKIGIRIAIDDFGEGYSNYSRLKCLNIDILKIDGSFIKDVITNEFDKKVVQSFCEIAKLKNAKTVAEFIENKETMDFLISKGIDYFQGYYISRPIELVDI
ncbi:EAL domain-containing protein [Citrobacter portucalensis]|uniref:EAL domain-containing protein n=1 Tax=Citrobacter portucalensis TaxID=1639133 RepID=UPI00226BABEC|nr:EAL domain-containing protein [Citrobacter portucalensis]MCX8986035.1 EAL domain-containing protein [Citrobacter portucalensis]